MSRQVSTKPATAPASNLRALDLLLGAEAGFALSVLDSSPDCIKLIELDGRLSFMNRNGLCAMEIEDFAQVDQQPWPSLWPQESRLRLNLALSEANAGRTSQFDAFCPTAKGSPRWWQVTVAPLRDQTGTVLRVMATSRDISETVRARTLLEEQAQRLSQEVAQKDSALARQKVLLGEIDHRVKNSFAAVIALLRMQARSHDNDEAAALLGDAANRISTLARVHEQLHLDPGSGAIVLQNYVAQLVADLGAGLNGRVAVTSQPGAPVQVTPVQAAAIGQILAELVGNAVKHGTTGRQTSVSIGLAHDPQANRLVLAVEDDGPGLPEGFDPEAGNGLGMQICSVYAQQLGGDLTAGPSASGGASFRVSMQIDAPQ